jgi:hypothetical protein
LTNIISNFCVVIVVTIGLKIIFRIIYNVYNVNRYREAVTIAPPPPNL